nr:MAG: hypothetical protein [Microviridae sp.]
MKNLPEIMALIGLFCLLNLIYGMDVIKTALRPSGRRIFLKNMVEKLKKIKNEK